MTTLSPVHIFVRFIPGATSIAAYGTVGTQGTPWGITYSMTTCPADQTDATQVRGQAPVPVVRTTVDASIDGSRTARSGTTVARASRWTCHLATVTRTDGRTGDPTGRPRFRHNVPVGRTPLVTCSPRRGSVKVKSNAHETPHRCSKATRCSISPPPAKC